MACGFALLIIFELVLVGILPQVIKLARLPTVHLQIFDLEEPLFYINQSLLLIIGISPCLKATQYSMEKVSI